MKHNAFGAIDLLIGLVLIAVVFLLCVNTLTGVSSLKFNDSALDTKSIQQQVDRQVREIENMRQQSINYSHQQDY